MSVMASKASQLLCNGKCFFAQRGQFDEDGRLPFAPAADGLDQRDAVVAELVFQPQGHAPLAAGHAGRTRTDGRNESRHPGITPCE